MTLQPYNLPILILHPRKIDKPTDFVAKKDFKMYFNISGDISSKTNTLPIS